MEKIRPMVKAIVVVIRHGARKRHECIANSTQGHEYASRAKSLLTNVYSGDIRYEVYNR